MTAGSADFASDTQERPILVLGVGNVLLGDDGFGPALLEELIVHNEENAPGVEFVDGGTQGLALLGLIANRRALVILDALDTGEVPGTVSVLAGLAEISGPKQRSCSAHESNAMELLSVAALLGDLPDRLYVVGVQPESVCTRLGLSPAVQKSIGPALEKTQQIVDQLVFELAPAVEV
ncbi:MAG: hydrogenase maturation protease [Acidobacteriia bacterium]|nr:hydrogenase maturation protease [Terriglobia bacterium]